MRIDRDAAAVVGDRHKTVGLHLDVDPVGVAGQRLVHGVVDDFGEQMMQRLLVGAADIHAGAAAHRFEPLQNLDVLGGVAGFAAGAGGRAGGTARGAATAFARVGEQVRRFGGFRRFGSFSHQLFTHGLTHVECHAFPCSGDRRIKRHYAPDYAI